MEQLQFFFEGTNTVSPEKPVIAGVVGSGNLEILMEPSSQPGCTITVNTSAKGFRTIWEAVLRDFHSRYDYDRVQITINDMGATPAVVDLRLDQAASDFGPALNKKS